MRGEPVAGEALLLGSLGGPETFGGQAALRAQTCYPEFATTRYFDTAEEALGEQGPWQVDATCVPEQMSLMGFLLPTQRRLLAARERMFVLGNVTHPYHCTLLAAPGSQLTDVATVLGHTGSITQSRPWLEEHLPDAAIEIVHTNTLEAGQRAVSGDGSVAVVGTPPLGERLGLVALAHDIDGGSVGHYWLMGPEPRFDASPTWLVVAGTLDDRNDAGVVLAGLSADGFALRSLWTEPIGDRLFHASFVATLVGGGELVAVRERLALEPDLWLAGAFVSREPSLV